MSKDESPEKRTVEENFERWPREIEAAAPEIVRQSDTVLEEEFAWQ
jgi:hypothetical protein